MDKNEINRILCLVRKECLYANGCRCKFNYKTINWLETYYSKKGFFKYRWEMKSSCSNYHNVQMEECELILKKLPKGLSYTKETILERDELKSVEPHKEYMSARKWYKTIYTVWISEPYSQKVLKSLGKSRAFIDGFITTETETKAYDFKKKVLKLYSNLVTDMYSAFEHGNNYICSSGLGQYESDVKIKFSDYKLKPLTKEYQYIGLALAIAEQGSVYLTTTELFRINSAYYGAFIDKIDTTPKNTNNDLHEW